MATTNLVFRSLSSTTRMVCMANSLLALNVEPHRKAGFPACAWKVSPWMHVPPNLERGLSLFEIASIKASRDVVVARVALVFGSHGSSSGRRGASSPRWADQFEDERATRAATDCPLT